MSVHFQHDTGINSAALNRQCVPRISCRICQQWETRERNPFSALRSRSMIQRVLWVVLQKRGKEMNPGGGGMECHKAPEMEERLSGREPPSVFPTPMVVFHLACETAFLPNISIT